MESDRSSDVHRTVAILSALGSKEATERGCLGVVEIAGQAGREKSFQGRVRAAVNVSAPKYRMRRELDAAARVAVTAARQISQAMAGR